VRVRIPQALQSYTGQAALVEAEGATLDDLLVELDRRYPGIRFRMIDEQDDMRPHVSFFVNGVKTFRLDEPLAGCHEVAIVQALSGG
jgi:molybdopterin converting factor small subunit